MASLSTVLPVTVNVVPTKSPSRKPQSCGAVPDPKVRRREWRRGSRKGIIIWAELPTGWNKAQATSSLFRQSLAVRKKIEGLGPDRVPDG